MVTNEYIPSPRDSVRDQVALIEATDGREGNSLRDWDCVIVTHKGQRTGAIRKTPLIRVADGDNYILVGSQGGAPKHPQWVHNLRADGDIELRDKAKVERMHAREVEGDERARLWEIAVAAFYHYGEYQEKTDRVIPVFIAEPA